jgi:hypothetical protein
VAAVAAVAVAEAAAPTSRMTAATTFTRPTTLDVSATS